MATKLKTWTSKRGEEVGVSVTHQAVEFWRIEPSNVQHRVCLAGFLYAHVGIDQAEFLVGEEKTVEIYDYVSALMEANRDYWVVGASILPEERKAFLLVSQTTELVPSLADANASKDFGGPVRDY